MQNLKGSYLKKLVDECVRSYEVNERPQRTVINLKNFLSRFLVWLEDRELTPKECREYIKYMQVDRGMAWTSVSSETRRLKMFLYFLKFVANDGDGVIDRDWAREVHSPRKYGIKEREPEQLLAPEKMMEFILKVTEPGENDTKLHRAAKLEHREFLLFFMKMGLRPGEAMNIKPEHVNLDGDPPSVLVWRGKNEKMGTIRVAAGLY